MCERPIEFSSLGVDWAEGKWVVANTSHRNHLGIVSGRENLICLLKILVSESLLGHTHATLAQQPDDPLAGDAGQKSSVWNRRKHHAVLRHENIRSREFGDIAQHVTDDGIVEASRLSFKKRTRIVGIETSRFGIDWHALKSWPAIGRERDGEALGSAHGRLVNRQTPPCRLGIVCLNPGSFVLCPIHWPDVKRGILVESFDPLAG